MTASKRALNFLVKFDPRRHKRMLDNMKNNALRRNPEAFPKTLPTAYRIASRWSGGEATPCTPTPGAPNAAYVIDSAHVTATKDPEKKAGKTGGAK